MTPGSVVWQPYQVIVQYLTAIRPRIRLNRPIGSLSNHCAIQTVPALPTPTLLLSALHRAMGRLMPSTCLLCDDQMESMQGLCDGCLQGLPWNTSACRRCALPLMVGHLCGACQTRPGAYDEVVAPVIYREPVDRIVCELKYSARLPWARTAAGLIVDTIHHRGEPVPDLLVPVPMTPRAVRRRGFHPSATIARLVAKHLKIRTNETMVTKRRETKRQSTLTHRERALNISGAFEVRQQPVGRTKLVLIDDVVTTGSTVAELARILKQAGASEVRVWAFARTPEKRG